MELQPPHPVRTVCACSAEWQKHVLIITSLRRSDEMYEIHVEQMSETKLKAGT